MHRTCRSAGWEECRASRVESGPPGDAFVRSLMGPEILVTSPCCARKDWPDGWVCGWVGCHRRVMMSAAAWGIFCSLAVGDRCLS